MKLRKSMLPGVAAVLLGMLYPVAAWAQTVQISGQSVVSASDDEDGFFCAVDVGTPAKRARFAQIMAQRRASGGGPLFAHKSFDPPQIGEEQNFNVRPNPDIQPPVWSSRRFRLVDVSDLYYMWVDVAIWNQTNGVVQVEVDHLRDKLLNHTPSGSINPNQGILRNEHDVFGLPPNVDGDGKVDILLYDIVSNGVLGFVTEEDVTPGLGPGVGNQRDVIHVDGVQGTIQLDKLAWVTAHEYTHLIHLSYGFDDTFNTEGMAEFGSVLNGYYDRRIDYLDTSEEVQLPLFTWRGGTDLEIVINDYERGGLFYTYLAEQHSPELVGAVMKDGTNAIATTLDQVLRADGSSLGDALSGFHTANMLQNRTGDPAFGYVAPQRNAASSFLMSRPTIFETVDGEKKTISDTEGIPSGYFTDRSSEHLWGGAVTYRRWTDVADFSLEIESVFLRVYEGRPEYENERLLQLGRLHASVVLDYADETRDTEYWNGSALELPRTFPGRFDRVDVYFMLTDPSFNSNSVGIDWRTDWTPLSQAVSATESDDLPVTSTLGAPWPNPFQSQASIPLTLQKSGQVRLEIFDMLGRSRAILADRILAAGDHVIAFDGSNLPSGMYFVKFSEEGGSVEGKMLSLVK